MELPSSYPQTSNSNSFNRIQDFQDQPRHSFPSSDQVSSQTQQQLPSFKEILPPPLHTAIDSSIQYSGADSHSTQSQQHHRPSISGQPSPNYSQSSSMPDSFDDFSHRNHEPVYQISAPQRPPHATNINQQYPDMAASYSTHRPQYHQPQQLGMRGSPGLPPIRDIDQGFGKFSNYDNGYMGSNGFSPMYGQPLNSTSQYGESYMSRRPSGPSYYDNKPVSQTYPPSNRPYPPIKPEPQSQYQPTSSYDTFNPREGFGYPYTSVGMPQAPPMYHPGGDTGDSRNRRRRGNLPKQITDVLRAWFQDHLDHPYPSEEEKQMFINTTGLSMNQISNWFINARRRHLPAMRQARDSRNNQGMDGGPQRQQR